MNRIRTGALCPSEGATLRVAPERRIPVRASVALTCPGMREYGRPFRRKTGKMSKRSVFGIAVLLLSLATAAACGDDSEPEPTQRGTEGTSSMDAETPELIGSWHR